MVGGCRVAVKTGPRGGLTCARLWPSVKPMNLPNIITIFRILLVPAMIYALLRQNYSWAVAIFLVASISDALDGYIARRFNLHTRLGAILDPLADKLLVAAVVILLTWLGWLPYWLTAAILLRDLVIVSGALAYHKLIGPVEVKPSYLSKFNTAAQFILIVLVLAEAARWLALGPVLTAGFVLIFASTVLSGLDYVWRWSRRAALYHKEGPQ